MSRLSVDTHRPPFCRSSAGLSSFLLPSHPQPRNQHQVFTALWESGKGILLLLVPFSFFRLPPNSRVIVWIKFLGLFQVSSSGMNRERMSIVLWADRYRQVYPSMRPFSVSASLWLAVITSLTLTAVAALPWEWKQQGSRQKALGARDAQGGYQSEPTEYGYGYYPPPPPYGPETSTEQPILTSTICRSPRVFVILIRLTTSQTLLQRNSQLSGQIYRLWAVALL